MSPFAHLLRESRTNRTTHLCANHCAHWTNDVLPQFKARYIDTGKVRLVFRDAQGAVAAMVLQPQPLRQWLGIVFDAWQQAEWPLEVWPDWLRESVPAKTVSAGGLMH